MQTRLFSTTLLGLGLGLALTLSACGGDDKPADSGGTEGTGSEGIDPTGDGDGDTTTTGDGDGDPTTTGDGDGDPTTTGGDGDPTGEPELCGNGMVDAGEQCDDGNTLSGDGCSATCQNEIPDGPIPCGNATYECGDTVDNDMDGMIDLNDPECISPCDDNEASFTTDLPGQNNDCKGDCYFDSNSGGGDDNCEWNLKCDQENPGAQIGCEYDPNLNQNMCALEMPETCLDFCVPLVPNGCDCFGCCEIEGQFVYLGGANCSLDNLGGCESCTFYENCNNACEPENCELCFGQDPEDLPEECGGEPTCPPELDPCLVDSDCAEGLYCQTGCCLPINIG